MYTQPAHHNLTFETITDGASCANASQRSLHTTAGGLTVRIVAPGGGTRVISLSELLSAMPGFQTFSGTDLNNSTTATPLVGPVSREALAALSDRVLTAEEVNRLPDGQQRYALTRFWNDIISMHTSVDSCMLTPVILLLVVVAAAVCKHET
jgi:hypothetical protein